MACWGLIPRFWVKDKGFKEDDAVWGEKKIEGAPPPPPATELRCETYFVCRPEKAKLQIFFLPP